MTTCCGVSTSGVGAPIAAARAGCSRRRRRRCSQVLPPAHQHRRSWAAGQSRPPPPRPRPRPPRPKPRPPPPRPKPRPPPPRPKPRPPPPRPKPRPPPPRPKPRPPPPRPKPRPPPPRPKPRPPPPRPKPKPPSPKPRPPPPRPKPKPPSPKPPSPPPRPPPPSLPGADCVKRIPQCTTCAIDPLAADGDVFNKYRCSACDAYSTLDPNTGWLDPITEELYDVPFCDGVCDYIFRTVAKAYDFASNTIAMPCTDCSSGGCGMCMYNTFKYPDSVSKFLYPNNPTIPTTCLTCGDCATGKCSTTGGCSQCYDATSTPMLMASMSATVDANNCIWDYCLAAFENAPQQTYLYSYYPNCRGDPSTWESSCNSRTGCTACEPGYFRARNPLTPTAARCVRCEGCPSNLCGANGCASCPVEGLGLRTPMVNIATPSGGVAYVCKNSTDPAKAVAFRGSSSLPSINVWPVSEFGNCGVSAPPALDAGPDVGEMGGVGDIMIQWSDSAEKTLPFDFNVEVTLAAWTALTGDPQLIGGISNATISFTINFETPTRASLNLTFTDKNTGQRRTQIATYPLPRAQDAVCVVFFNTVPSNAAEINMNAQLTIVNNSGKKILLKFNGGRSFTNRVLPGSLFPNEVFPGGYVSLYGRNGRLLGSRTSGVDFAGALKEENLVVLPSIVEWDAFK